MDLSIGEKQELFSALLPRLLDHALDLGYRIRLRELWRTQEQAQYNATHCGYCQKKNTNHSGEDHKFRPTGIRDSLHCLGLAIDFYVRKPPDKSLWVTEYYEPLGVFWEDLHALTCWGGRFGDHGHFSISHDGRQ